MEAHGRLILRATNFAKRSKSTVNSNLRFPFLKQVELDKTNTDDYHSVVLTIIGSASLISNHKNSKFLLTLQN